MSKGIIAAYHEISEFLWSKPLDILQIRAILNLDLLSASLKPGRLTTWTIIQ